MSAPKRWLDDPGVPDDERDLLQAGLGMDPPPEAQAAVWAALLARVPALPPPPGGSGAVAGKAAAAKAGAAASGAAAVGTGILKSALLGAGSAVALLATYAVVAPPPTAAPPEPPPPAVVVAAPPPDRAPPRFAPSAPAAPREATEPSATPTSATAAPGASAAVDHRADARPSANATPSGDPDRATAPPTDRETLLREESRLVSEARDALRGGDAARALGLLEQLRARFPGGMLAQEREALTIEALARSGRRADASARAAAFLQAYPTSPLAARVQTFAN